MGTEPVKRWIVGLLTLVMLCFVAACGSPESGEADACVSYERCNKRCPFHVDQAARMQEILAYFYS